MMFSNPKSRSDLFMYSPLEMPCRLTKMYGEPNVSWSYATLGGTSFFSIEDDFLSDGAMIDSSVLASFAFCFLSPPVLCCDYYESTQSFAPGRLY